MKIASISEIILPDNHPHKHCSVTRCTPISFPDSATGDIILAAVKFKGFTKVERRCKAVVEGSQQLLVG